MKYTKFFILIILYCILPSSSFGSTLMKPLLKKSNTSKDQEDTSKPATPRNKSPSKQTNEQSGKLPMGQSRQASSTSQSKPTLPTSQLKQTPTTSQSKAAPSTSKSKEAPPTSQSKQAPPTSQSKQSLTTSQSKPAPPISQSKQSSTTSQSKQAPPTSQSKQSLTTKKPKPKSAIKKLKSLLKFSPSPSIVAEPLDRTPSKSDATYGSRFFNLIELLDLLKTWQGLSEKYGWGHEKMIPTRESIRKILKNFDISKGTIRAFDERSTAYPGHSLEHMRVLLHRICKQFGQLGTKEKPKNDVYVYSSSRETFAALGLTGKVSKVYEIGYCRNDLEPNVYIMLGREEENENERCFMLAIDFRDDDPASREPHPTRKVLEHFYTRKSGHPEKMFLDNPHLQSMISDYRATKKSIDDRNKQNPHPVPPKSYKNDFYYRDTPKQITMKIFHSTFFTSDFQPSIHTSGINEAYFDELCADIGRGEKYEKLDSQLYLGKKEIFDTVYLFESIDKKEGIKLLGICNYKYQDTIYVYLAERMNYKETYMLAIHHGNYRVVVDHFRVYIMDEIVSFETT